MSTRQIGFLSGLSAVSCGSHALLAKARAIMVIKGVNITMAASVLMALI